MINIQNIRIKHIRSTLFSGIVIFFCSALILPAQLMFNKVEIGPPYRVSFYCSQLPDNFTSELSADKKRVTIRVPGASVQDSARQTHSGGIVEDVYINSKEGNLEIMIVLKSKRGYTAVPLPYSNALMAEFFRWDQINPTEDNYRMGLLALTDGIGKAAEKYLKKASDEGHVNASAFYGIILLQRGSVTEAAEKIEYALKSGSDIPDAYAAATQLLRMNNYPNEAEKYADAFKKLTGLSYVAELPVEIPDDAKPESTAAIETALYSLVNDSTLFSISANDSVPTTDSAKEERFAGLFGPDSTADGNSGGNPEYDSSTPSVVPEWFTQILIYVGIFVIIFSVILIFAYFRWRRNQASKKIDDSDSVTNDAFDEKLEKARKTLSEPNRKEAVKAYTKAGSVVDRTVKEKSTAGKKQEKTEKQKVEEKAATEIRSKAEKEEEDKNKLMELLSKVKESKSEEGKTVLQKEEPKPKKSEGPPRIELAMHLQEEQRRIKEKDISSIKQQDLPTDVKKLSEVARKLGIETSGLETKKKIDKLSSDKDAMSQLEKKFSVNKDKDK